MRNYSDKQIAIDIETERYIDEEFYKLNRARNLRREARIRENQFVRLPLIFEKEEIKMKKLAKFYCAAPHIASSIANGINSDWTHYTEADAIEHAKKIMEKENRDTVVIVKIVTIVRKAKTPVQIERIK